MSNFFKYNHKITDLTKLHAYIGKRVRVHLRKVHPFTGRTEKFFITGKIHSVSEVSRIPGGDPGFTVDRYPVKMKHVDFIEVNKNKRPRIKKG